LRREIPQRAPFQFSSTSNAEREKKKKETRTSPLFLSFWHQREKKRGSRPASPLVSFLERKGKIVVICRQWKERGKTNGHEQLPQEGKEGKGTVRSSEGASLVVGRGKEGGMKF